MKAALWYAKKDIRVEEVDEPKVTKGSKMVWHMWVRSS